MSARVSENAEKQPLLRTALMGAAALGLAYSTYTLWSLRCGKVDEVDVDPAVAMSRPVYTALLRKISSSFKPIRLSIVDESHLHRGHAGMKNFEGNASGESHFKMEVVSESFVSVPRLQRQKRVFEVIKEEMQGIHAMSMVCRTPEEDRKAAQDSH